ncbi:ubiquitin-like protein [Arabidopsis thaliana]|uniref:Ubiquitin family protein n=1 Tax=Arabidopsis thaliana TaxID=3702 RepID=Q9FY81_ARATH|nr:Ubiquitin family protein [Arabidopsis thaliana]AED91379.1 Ubiquitin family protein [Arabidopsis thaliana]CAC05460.1 ubiquitin-like protein [Arabidopsis thaliana]|eukprot:NP_196496.1 Ubiquitin family protein [Arabidopsis thaliana]
MQVFIIDEDGKKYCVEVEKTTTIADMKTKIYDATGMENAYQYLEHRGKIVLEVHGGTTMDDYKIKACDIFHMSDRMRGG